jgi:hypothetical protein
MDDIIREREARARHVLTLVEELGSVKSAAAQLGISEQRVRQLIAPGAFRVTIEATCQDCGRATRVRRDAVPRCRRCRRYLAANGRAWTAAGAVRKGAPRETHCHQGHPLSGTNLYVAPSGLRVCRVCARQRSRRYRAAKRETRPPMTWQQIRDRLRPDPPTVELIEPADRTSDELA